MGRKGLNLHSMSGKCWITVLRGNCSSTQSQPARLLDTNLWQIYYKELLTYSGIVDSSLRMKTPFLLATLTPIKYISWTLIKHWQNWFPRQIEWARSEQGYLGDNLFCQDGGARHNGSRLGVDIFAGTDGCWQWGATRVQPPLVVLSTRPDHKTWDADKHNIWQTFGQNTLRI